MPSVSTSVGFGRLTFESIAERAGTGKSPRYVRDLTKKDITAMVDEVLMPLVRA